jgi:hypothetical protein
MKRLILQALKITLVGILAFFMYSKVFTKKNQEPSFENDGKEQKSRITEIHHITSNSSGQLENLEFVGMKNDAGRVNSLAIDWSNPNHMIAGADAGGLWKSINRGKTWAYINDYANSLNITCIAQNKFKKNVYYYSTGVNYNDNGNILNDIYKSKDGGNTFENVNIAPSSLKFGRIEKIVCSHLDSNTIYFSNTFGLLNPDGTIQLGGLYRTTDDFVTATRVFSGQVHDFYFSSNGEILLSSGINIYRSTNGNAGSFILTGGLNTTDRIISIATSASQPNIAYSVSFNINNTSLKVYKSTNGGSTWTFLKSLGNGGNSKNFIAVHPSNPNFVMIGSIEEFYSTDGGINWTKTSIGFDVRDLLFDPTNNKELFISHDWGINSVTIDPLTPNSFNLAFAKSYDSTLLNQCIYHGDFRNNSNENITGLQDQGSHFTNNDKNTTKLIRGDGIMPFYHRQDTTLAYICPQGGQITRVKNPHKANWTTEVIADRMLTFNSEPMGFFTHYSINPNNCNQLFIPTQRRLWRTLNAKDWIPISRQHIDNSGSNYSAISNSFNPTLYWALNDSIFAMKNASTSSFTEIGKKSPDAARVEKIFIDPFNELGLYFLKKGLPSKISYTSDFFAPTVVWKNLNFPSNLTPRSFAIWPTNNNVILVGTLEGGLYISKDAGSTWIKDSNFPNVRINDIKIRPSDNKIFIFTYGRGAWAADLPNIPILVKTNKISTSLGVEIFPNPAHDFVYVPANLLIGNFNIEIVDLDGKLILSSNSIAGQQARINVKSIPSGFYVLHIKDQSKIIYSKKFIKN